ncbi:MAG: UDP-N-acetylmuramate dehydrogenase [Anaerolineae bacterium]|nr:UDP-N-acetylmuramate dehydrogenase [Anaerolineae bacterium]
MTDFTPLREIAGDKLKLNEPLHRYTVARLGGPADALVIADSVDVLERTARLAWDHGWQTRILGGGANVLIGDRGFRGLIIINNAKAVKVHDDGRVICESGAGMIRLAHLCMDRGLAGAEWMVSVPGTVGGGVVNNAGAHGGEMSGSLTSAEIAFKDRPTETWTRDQMQYRYRESALKHNPQPLVVLRAELQFQTGADPAQLHAKADEFVAHRKRTQPPGASLGSMFKNPAGDYSGRLIEAAGLKGTQHGGVIISPLHGNFFVNTGTGTAADYLALIRLAQETVKAKFGVELELEVELMGEFA